MSKKPFDYVDDYKSKVQYLKDHFTRLWTRFNFFLTLQSALFGVSILAPEKYHILIPIFGIMLCFCWYIFGVQDRFLVALYRKQIKQAWDKVKFESENTEELEKYCFIGQTEKIDRDNEGNYTLKNENNEDVILTVEKASFQKRFENFSITKLAAISPIFIAAFWILVILYFCYVPQ